MTTKLLVREEPAIYRVLQGVRTVRLGDVAVSMKNGIYKSKDAYADDGIACLRMYNIGDGRIIWRDIKRMSLSEQERTEYGLEPGDLLVNRVNSRELVGKTALVTAGIERSVFESKNIRVRLDRSLVEPAYVNYALLALGRAHFNRNAQQVVGMASVSQPQVAAFEFKLRPIAQQREVVNYLDEQLSRLDASVAALHRVQANLKRYRAGVLKSACEGRLVPNEAEIALQEGRVYETGVQLLQRVLAERYARSTYKGKHKEFVAAGVCISKLPQGWSFASLDQLCEPIVDCPHSTARFVASGHPCIDTNWMTKDGLAIERARYVSPSTYADRVSRLTPTTGDIVFAREGTIGTAVVVPQGMEPCLGQRVMLLRAAPSVSNKFLVLALHSEVVIAQYLEQSLGSTVPHINVRDVKRFAIPLPPLAEQHRIVAEADRRLSLTRVAEAQVAANLARAQRLRQSILQAAFSA